MTTEAASYYIYKLLKETKHEFGKEHLFRFYINENEEKETVRMTLDTKKDSYSLGSECIYILELEDKGQVEKLDQQDVAELLEKYAPHRFEPFKQPLCYYARRIEKRYEASGIGDKGYLTWDEINMLQMVFKKHLVSQCVEHWKTGEKHFWMDVDKYDIYAESVIDYNYAVFYGQSTDIHDKKKELVRFKDGELEKVYFDHNESNTMTVINALQEWINNPPQDENR